MHWLPALAGTCLLLAGCDFDPGPLFDLVDGREKNKVILVGHPLVLRPQPTVLASTEPLKILGQWSSLCLPLRGGLASQDWEAVKAAFADGLGGAKVTVWLTLTNGERVTLRQPGAAWALHGDLLGRGELSACASLPCHAPLPSGTGIRSIEVSSDRPLAVQGILWKSESDLHPAAATAKPALHGGAAPTPSTCGRPS